MADLGEYSNKNPSISLSRNTPTALVVGGAGFIGSHLVDALLQKGIQVIGVDNLISGKKENLQEAVKNKRFHFINSSVSDGLELDLSRLDYAFFAADVPPSPLLVKEKEALFREGLQNFLKISRKHSPKICFISSISLYDNKIPSELEDLKLAEINFAKFVKKHNLNARIVRLSGVFGPRMSFYSEDPVSRLLQACLLGELQKEQTSLDFSSRSLFIDDAISLIVKSVFYGGTAHKIYDGVAPHPIKVSEIKQILLDPLWYENKGFSATEIPPWPTPNLKKSLKELSFRPRVGIVRALKETVLFFKESSSEIPKLEVKELEAEMGEWLEKEPKIPPEKLEATSKTEVKDKEVKKESRGFRKHFKNLGWYLGGLAVLYAIAYPVATLLIGGLTIKSHLENSSKAMEAGDFNRAKQEISYSKASLGSLNALLDSSQFIKEVPFFRTPLESVSNLASIVSLGIEGVDHAEQGTEALFKTTKTVSGEEGEDPKALFAKASLELDSSSRYLSQAASKLDDPGFSETLPSLIRARVGDLGADLKKSQEQVGKEKVAANILPSLEAIDGKKSYLVLLQDNLELRGTGGYISAYSKLDFEGGRVKTIKSDSTASLDANFKDHVEPPEDLKTDLGKVDWKLSDSNYDPDFPVSAKRAEFFFTKESGDRVNGVIALDLVALQRLIKAVSGIENQDYSESLTGDDYLNKVLSHGADVSSLNTKQKSYLASSAGPLLNKIFFLSNQNWPAIISALSSSLEDKHMMVFMDDPDLFSYALSENWTGVVPRPANPTSGKTEDFLFTADSNMGQNLVNYYIDKSYNLETSITPEGVINHHLEIHYKNSSPDNTFPEGIYKDRFRIYLPLGARLNKASLGSDDLTKNAGSFSDYGRAGYSLLLNLSPGQEKILSLDYTLSESLDFQKQGEASNGDYRLTIIKQPGTNSDKFNWNITFPDSFKLTSLNGESVTSAKQETSFATNLSTDQSLTVGFSK